ncbi:ester cyclase [Roseicyclus persicicus]|uniref:Ester cyclase n=1 Tax=Roseicyclus persicicus TaxID=2650661 RepID=A0A7X6GWL5_9RHOB|nr:ester cyclase [Roseibacterium persicicum]NKX43719.1 ester cyclase [Roseibacterium persicicum]
MTPAALKSLIVPFRTALATATPDAARAAARALFAPDAVLHLCHPFGDLAGPDALVEVALGPLMAALPDLERRDMIVVAGTTPEGADWVACMGSYMGRFDAPFLGIPPTGRLAHMRYHEYFRVADGRVTEMQAIWDIPELMMQAGAWPLAPQLGAYLATPGPMSGDGLAVSGDGSAAMTRVVDMLTDLCRHPADPDPAVMRLETHWHPRVNWYGPAGIGTARGIDGFRRHHQIPFLRAFPDRKLDALGNLMSHWIAEGDYVAETGWPNMRLTHRGGGFLGLAPSGREVTLRSLDFWRVEGGLIRENWVLVDLLDFCDQIGLDVLARMEERA